MGSRALGVIMNGVTGVKDGVVHDKLFLPGLLKLRRLLDGGLFGRLLSVRGEFGYWVFEGDRQRSQRPSWNYRAEEGGGIVVDMFCLRVFDNGFKAQWEQFVRHVARGDPHPYDFLAGARGLRLAEAGRRSSAERRTIDLEELAP